ncbi:50S ribosomal protein L18 [Candidatus Kaiserbacteria bacterium]|nr:50S ribosomal protein L18 [Candidatus Kaiserbacteria bacterium]
MKKGSGKQAQRERRHARIRARITGTATRPRLAVFRSNRFIYAQLIDDEACTTLVAADSRSVAGKTTRERAGAVGKALAEAAKSKGIETVVFDRGGFQYQGAIAALADGARGAGLVF